MRVLEIVCEAGLGTVGLNEDRAGSAGNVAWVLDGGTSIAQDVYLPASSDVQWLVDFIQARLGEFGGRGFMGSVSDLVWRLYQEVSAALERLDFPATRMHPTCTLGIALDRGEVIELARVGDTVLVATGAVPVVLQTSFFDRREAAAVSVARTRADVSTATGIARRRLDYILGKYDESVFSGHPNARIKIGSVAFAASSVDQLLLCSDGLSRAVVDYGLFATWEDLAVAVGKQGLAEVVSMMRRFEASLEDDAYPHFKKTDDVAGVLAIP